ncbi:MAG: chemotaxis protein CheX [Thermoplasmatales archaeon]
MNYSNLASESFKDVVKVLSGLDLGEPGYQETSINSIQDWLDCTSFMTMRGNKLFLFFAISADQKALQTMYLKLFNEHLNSVNSDAGDLLGEVCNQTAGRIKTKLSPNGHTFDMCSPVVVFGNNVRVRNLADLSGALYTFNQEEGKTNIFVHFQEL